MLDVRLVVVSVVLAIPCACGSAPQRPSMTAEPEVKDDDSSDRAKWDARMAALRDRAEVPGVGVTADDAKQTCDRDSGEWSVVAVRNPDESRVVCTIGGRPAFTCDMAYRHVIEREMFALVTTRCERK